MAISSQVGRAVLGAALVTAFAIAPARAAAPTAPVAVGDYEATPVVEEGGTYSTGLFSVAKDRGRRTLVPTAGYDAIFYPDNGKCDSFSLPLLAADVPIKPTGRFRIKEATPVEDGMVEVDWKARWTKAKKVEGSITIKYGGCTSTFGWNGRKIPSVPSG